MTVSQLISEACGESLQGDIRASVAANNSVLAGCNVHWLFRGSIVDLETGMHGIRWTILRILSQAADKGMTTAEVIAAVRLANGADKYPDRTILHNLGVVLTRAGQVVGIRQPVTRADGSKTSRKFWYVVQS
jgi:hypothetical protein